MSRAKLLAMRMTGDPSNPSRGSMDSLSVFDFVKLENENYKSDPQGQGVLDSITL